MKKMLLAVIMTFVTIIGMSTTAFATSEATPTPLSSDEAAEIRSVYATLAPEESAHLSNGKIFIKAPSHIQPRALCGLCGIEQREYYGIVRLCVPRSDGYCNVEDATIYSCSRCGLYEGSVAYKTKNHRTGGSGCTV